MSADILNFVTQYTLYSSCIIFSLGVIGNVMVLIVFTKLKLFRDNRCAFYLTIEAISNLSLHFTSIISTIFTSIYGDYGTGRFLVWCKLRYILGQTFLLVTYYIICCAAVDQFFSTNYHVYFRQMCTLKMSRGISLILVCVLIIHSIIFGMFFDIQPSVGCLILNETVLRYATFFVYPIFAGLLPIIIASLFSLLAFRNVRRIVRRQLPMVRRRLDRQMTAMILIRVIFFVCLALPYSVYRVYALNFPVSKKQPLEYAITQLIQAIFLSFTRLNYMVNFYVFLMSSARFRRQVKYVLLKKCWKRWKYYCCCEKNQIAPDNRESFSTNIELEEDI